jgi:hypothetical protein
MDSMGFTFWRYITHNAIYWMWLKLGVIGFACFLYLIGSALLLGCLVFRYVQDGLMKVVALLATGHLAMQVIFSYGDMGLTGSRTLVYLALWMGILAALYRIAPPPARPAATGID